MRKLTLADVKDLTSYEKVRDASRREMIALKARRRVALGDRISLVFENTRTALGQVQEMVRAERIVHDDRIQFEIDTYNALIPDPGEISATLFIEITGAADIRSELDRLLGLDRPGCLFLEIGEGAERERIPARFEGGHSTESRISAVHYLRFALPESARQRFLDARCPVALVLEHPACLARTPLAGAVREELIADLSLTGS